MTTTALDDTPFKEHINVLKKMVNFADIEKISAKSDWEGIKQTGFHLFLLVVSSLYLNYALQTETHWILSALLKSSAFLIHSFFISFLFMPLHEALHRTVFTSYFANQVLAWITGFLTFRLPRYYVLYHFPHHNYTGNPKKDPELMDSLLDLKLTSMTQYLLYLSGIPFWLDRILLFSRLLMGKVTEPWLLRESSKKEVVFETRYCSVLYCCLFLHQYFTGSTFLWNYWILPSFIGQVFLRFYLIAEHTGCVQTTNMMENTRTIYTHWLYRKLAWNMPYHAEHHAFPQVPFHALDKAHELVNRASVEKTKCKPNGKNGYVGVNVGLVKGFLSKTN